MYQYPIPSLWFIVRTFYLAGIHVIQYTSIQIFSIDATDRCSVTGGRTPIQSVQSIARPGQPFIGPPPSPQAAVLHPPAITHSFHPLNHSLRFSIHRNSTRPPAAYSELQLYLPNLSTGKLPFHSVFIFSLYYLFAPTLHHTPVYVLQP